LCFTKKNFGKNFYYRATCSGGEPSEDDGGLGAGEIAGIVIETFNILNVLFEIDFLKKFNHFRNNSPH